MRGFSSTPAAILRRLPAAVEPASVRASVAKNVNGDAEPPMVDLRCIEERNSTIDGLAG